jgi:hypothetical protein
MDAQRAALAYTGLTADEARERARAEHRPLRVIKPGDLVTMEYVENRITVTVADGRVVRATAG